MLPITLKPRPPHFGLLYSSELFQPVSPKNGSMPTPVDGVNSWRMLGEKPNESPIALNSSVETNSGVVLRPL